MSIESYRPLRVMRQATVMASTPQELGRMYPHASIERAPAGGVMGVYHIRQIIDCPTVHEREMLGLNLDGKGSYAVEIPQHRDGYDIPTSGVARSRKGSMKGRQVYEVTVQKAKMEERRAKDEREQKAEVRRKQKEKEAEERAKFLKAKKDKSAKSKSSDEDKLPEGGDK